MRTPAQIAGHPMHPMLVTVPIGLWLFSLVCDLVATRSGNPETWTTVALYAMVGGCVGAAAAALPGLVDFLSLRDRDTRRTALAHMVLNITVLTLFAVNAVLRGQGAIDHGTSLGLSAVAVVLLGVSGWLGGKMVYEKGVGVHAGADEALASAANEPWTPRPAPGRRGDEGSVGWRARTDHAVAQDRPGRESDRARAERGSER